jgi:hypothetical protein
MDSIRYFVGRPSDGDGKPTLEQEVASEPEALVIAFKNDSRVYLVNEYRVTQRIEGGQVRLEKEEATSAKPPLLFAASDDAPDETKLCGNTVSVAADGHARCADNRSSLGSLRARPSPFWADADVDRVGQ